ncbi:MAG TPA: HNH endonuclease signature motif containing protein, partial [Actinomycetota bacterium]|nr:HNH endonuclease signature motif containing protein [Actinomycetota bacterium]
PSGWCEAHHVVHWADGGDTKLHNLVLLCRRHHRMLHDGFGLRMTEHGPVFTRPDGTVLEEVVVRAPP